MKRLTKNVYKTNIKENINTSSKMQILLQEEKKKDGLDSETKETDYGLGHIYGSW